jgi:hypothetical protein
MATKGYQREYMTRKEFEAYRLSVEKEKFSKSVSDPIAYGIERTIFRKQKLKKLIDAGKNIDSRTVKAKVERWKRQLNRLDLSQEHLTELRKDLTASRLDIRPLPTPGRTQKPAFPAVPVTT